MKKKNVYSNACYITEVSCFLQKNHDFIHNDKDSIFIISCMAVFDKLQYTNEDDYLTISGNFAATSERLLQFSCIVAVRITCVPSETKEEEPFPFIILKARRALIKKTF